jgi:hypothetical protein
MITLDNVLAGLTQGLQGNNKAGGGQSATANPLEGLLSGVVSSLTGPSEDVAEIGPRKAKAAKSESQQQSGGLVSNLLSRGKSLAMTVAVGLGLYYLAKRFFSGNNGNQ